VYDDTLSSAMLAANPYLSNSSGHAHPLIGLTLSNTGSDARSVWVTFRLGDLQETVLEVGPVTASAPKDVLWYLEPSDAFLTVLEDEHTEIAMTLVYTNAEGVTNKLNVAFPITIRPRNTRTTEPLSYWVVPADAQTNARSIGGIWDELRAQVALASDDDKVQYPFETLNKKRGDRTDIAVLFASALVKNGHPVSFAHATKGTYVWVRLGNDFVVIDPALVDKTLKNAIEQKPGKFTLENVQEIQAQHHLQPQSMDARFLPGHALATKTTFIEECDCILYCGQRGLAVHTIVNQGFVPAHLCAASNFSSIKKDNQQWCFTLQPGKERVLRHGWKDRGGCGTMTQTFTLWNASISVAS